MSYPETKMACVSNLWVRQMTFAKAGDRNEGHVHNFDHITLLSLGSVNVYVDDQVTTFKAPQMIYISKGKQHFLEALEDNTIAHCIHALRTGEREEDILDPSMIPKGVVNPLESGIARAL
jgi:quercetin dioxygenase-like cupin family protein